MENLRLSAVKEMMGRKPIHVNYPSNKTSDYFGINVFNKDTMKKYLSKDAYKSVENSIETGQRIDRKIADQVAAGMKDWAISRDATHYTHWFHPLTDGTAEKHDAFFEIDFDGQPFEIFDGDKLAQQEPDASSFPSGGIRNTFEARGYTAWDPSSPAFVIGKTLCIPTIFISYTGESLDYKTPLLKALNVMDQVAVDVCQYFDKNVSKVISTLGLEQEYFLVDEALYHARPDMMLTDRTLMGHASAKDQQLDDHYFGSIPERVLAFMYEMEVEAHKLGIPIKTRHNEVAPNQFECAPIYEETNLAVDHNQLLMDIIAKTARKHNFRAILHEKPYQKVNGSGKHNNWALATNTGVNLLSPGKTPKRNLQFITFLINTIKAVHDHGDMLRASIFSASNEHRLGGNEAPPSIMSVFLGKKLTEMLDKIEHTVGEDKMSTDEKTALKLDIGKIPEILLDNTDRNRTSPFAFTGNRFEFRAVGSAENCASPMVVLNTAVANQLQKFRIEVDGLIADGLKKDEAIFQVLRRLIIESKPVRFEGNGYSQEWVDEAEKRGLSNIKDAPEVFKAYVNKSNIELFEKHHVLTKRELESRYEVRIEKYKNKIQIESRVLADLAINHIVPTAIKYQNTLIINVQGLKSILSADDYDTVIGDRLETIKTISYHISSIKQKVKAMVNERKVANNLENCHEKVENYTHKVRPYLDDIRQHIDKLELIVDNAIWPLPKYRELLFSR